MTSLKTILPFTNDKGINANCAPGEMFSEWFLTCDLSHCVTLEEVAERYESLVRRLIRENITPVYEKAFGYLSDLPHFLTCRASVYRKFGFTSDSIPVSYVQGKPAFAGARFAGFHFYGIQIHQPSKVNVTDIVHGNGCHGKLIESGSFRQVFFMNLGGSKKANTLDRKTEINNAFADLDSSLLGAGFAPAHLLRTWFYLSDILRDYEFFNIARKDCFTGRIDNRTLPASTGIQGLSPAGPGISLDAMAVDAGHGCWPKIQIMSSPVQPEASSYGALFSRGVEIAWPLHKILYISGTASIDEQGRSVYTEDAELQIRNTLSNISALLEKYDASMNDVVHACVFLKKSELAPFFNKLAEENKLHKMACLRLIGDICRRDLFFEMDCVAIVHTNPDKCRD